MSRRTFSLKRLSVRSTPSVSLYSEIDTQQYAASEKQRDGIFYDSLHEFQQEFSKEEANQSIGERTRAEDFGDAMAEFEKIFKTRQESQQNLYREISALQDDTFQRSDRIREIVFSEGQSARAETFKIDQEFRSKRSEWHNAAREVLLQRSRQQLDETCAALEATLVNHFNRLLRDQEGSFLAQEQHRDALVVKLLQGRRIRDEIPSNISAAAVSQTVMMPVRQMIRPPSPLGAMTEIIYNRSRSRSQAEAEAEAEAEVVAVHSSGSSDRSFPRRISNSPSRSVYGSPSRRPPSRSPSPYSPRSPGFLNDPPTVVADENRRIPEGTTRNGTDLDGESTDSYDNQFTLAETERQGVFLEEERKREKRFQVTEAERDMVELERTKAFEKKEESWSTKAQTMLEAHEADFTGREATRAAAEIRRDEIFRAAQERRVHVFAVLLLNLERQAEAEERLEQDLAEHRKSLIDALYKKQSIQLSGAMDDRQYRFKKAQERRQSELGVVPSLSPPEMRKPHSREYPIPRPPVSLPIWWRCLEGKSQKCVNQPEIFQSAPSMRIPDTRPDIHVIGRHSPPVGFAPEVLFRGGPNVGDALPVAEFGGPVVQALRKELKFVNLQRRYQHIFEKSQEQREEAFEKAIQKRRHIFRASELKRVEKFEKAQGKRKQTFGDQEELRESAFQKARQRRERVFQAAEQQREVRFYEKEAKRDETFRKAQEDQVERFYAKHMALQRKCVESGKKRITDLDAWGMQLARNREKEQRKLFERQEVEFDHVFKVSLGTFISKDGY
ncbi:hypothetical protein H0H87_012869 [Tephrocybe sp. NHM501043]|nr:hypothetical protein H0H87_012869 [Tephrocybe sp. NHM501043]